MHVRVRGILAVAPESPVTTMGAAVVRLQLRSVPHGAPLPGRDFHRQLQLNHTLALDVESSKAWQILWTVYIHTTSQVSVCDRTTHE